MSKGLTLTKQQLEQKLKATQEHVTKKLLDFAKTKHREALDQPLPEPRTWKEDCLDAQLYRELRTKLTHTQVCAVCGRYSSPQAVEWLELTKIPNVELLRVKEGEGTAELPRHSHTTFHGFHMLNCPQSTFMKNLDVDKVPCHLCRKPDDEAMLMCEGCNNAVHMSCIGVTKIPTTDY